MRTGIITAGLLAGALLASPRARAEDVQKAKEDAQQDVSKAKADAAKEQQKARAEARQKVQKADTDASKKIESAQQDARQKVSDAKKQRQHRDTDAVVTTHGAKSSTTARRTGRHSIFEGKSNYDVKGRVEKVAGHSVTVHRDDLPTVTLSTDRATRITVNGDDQATTKSLRPGQDVKASFNLEGNKPVAVDIEANTHR